MLGDSTLLQFIEQQIDHAGETGVLDSRNLAAFLRNQPGESRSVGDLASLIIEAAQRRGIAILLDDSRPLQD